MTEKEAKVFLQGKLNCLKKCDVPPDDCGECEYCCAQGTRKEQEEALELAICVLELRTPEMPRVKGILWQSEIVQ